MHLLCIYIYIYIYLLVFEIIASHTRGKETPTFMRSLLHITTVRQDTQARLVDGQQWYREGHRIISAADRCLLGKVKVF